MKVLTATSNNRLIRPLFHPASQRISREKYTQWIPAANVEENEMGYEIRLAVPGMERPCFHVTAVNKELIVACKKEAKAAPGKAVYEYNYEQWERCFVMPDDADTALTQAHYANGELILRIPKNEAAINSDLVDVCIY